MTVHVRAQPRALLSTGALELAAFLTLSFAGTWTLMAVTTAPPVYALAVWLPGLVAIAIVRREGGSVATRLGVDRLGWADGYLVAYWLPVVFAVGLCAIAVVAGAARVDPDVGGLLPAGGGPSSGDAMQEVVNALTLAPLVNMLVVVGSELGWRAFLIPRLAGLGRWRAIVAVSILWSLWQMVPMATALPAFDWTVSAIYYALVGVLMGWLFTRTGSVWAPALFAGVVGATSGISALVLRDVTPLAAGPASLLGLVLPALAVLAVIWTRPASTTRT